MADGCVKAVLFDLYNTLIEIETDEQSPELWRQLALFVEYHGLSRDPEAMRLRFVRSLQEQQAATGEKFPEVDFPALFRSLFELRDHQLQDELGLELARLFRALGRRRLQLFADTLPALQRLSAAFPLALVSDAQRLWLEPELRELGLTRFFPIQVVSSDLGFRKPDPRMFREALERLGVEPADAIFVGDSAYRDVGGAQGVGIRGCLVTRHPPFEKADHLVVPDLVVSNLNELTERLVSP